MTEFYCKCINVRVVVNDSPISTLFSDRDNLPENERTHEFFKQLPLNVTLIAEVVKEQPSLVLSETIGSWIVYKCINCLTYLYAISESSNSMLINNSLSQMSAKEFKNIVSSPDYSPVYKILIVDYSTPQSDPPSRVLEEYSSDEILEIRRQLMDNIEKQKKITEEKIQKFIEEQQSLLKEYILRADNDFQILKKILSIKENEPLINSYEDHTAKSTYYSTILENINTKTNENVEDSTMVSVPVSEKNWDKDISLTDIPPSLDSEGLFPLDGMEENTIIEDDEHSDDDLSDTDDSGSRDEGIHIPRRKSIAFARSLPIRVPNDFDPSNRSFDDRFEDGKAKPNYKQNRNERPLDIPASIRALANSVHGDAIFGDLPRRKAGFRI